MTVKIALHSVIRNSESWVALIITSVALSVVLTLNVALIVAGTATEGEAQQAYVAMGGVALGFSILTGLASFVLVVGICVRLQRRDVALWQIVGLLPSTAFFIMLIEIFLVSVISAVIGALVCVLAWPCYANLVGDSGLPYSNILDSPIPISALVIGVVVTTTVCILAGLNGSRKVVRGNLVEGIQSSSAFEAKPTSLIVRIVYLVIGAALLIGVGAIYGAIGRGEKITDSQGVGDFLTVYPGMGMLLCLVFALLGAPFVQLLVSLIKLVPARELPKFLASREAAARPRLTQALVIPMSLAAAAVGVMIGWVGKVKDVLMAESGSANSVSAPPEQMILLLGGPVIVACVAAAAIVFATAPNRQEDNALLMASGATHVTVYIKAIIEALVYGVVALACAYLIVIVNEIAMVTALSKGPIPSASLSWPGWASAGVVVFGIVLTAIMLLVITMSGLRKQTITTILGGK